MLQHYVLASAGLFFSYWSGAPLWTYAILLTLHLTVFGVLQTPTIHDSSLEFAVARVLSLAFACGTAGICTWLIRKPPFRFYSATFTVWQLVVGALWCGTLVSWQLAPQVYWNFVFIVSIAQALIILFSLLWLGEEQSYAWDYNGNKMPIYICYHHFAALWFLLQTPFVIGQLVRPAVWPFYYTVAFAGASLLYLFAYNARIRSMVPSTVVIYAFPYDPNDSLEISQRL